MAPLYGLGTQAAGYPGRVSASTPLGTYLNDHLAGSEAAIELIDGLRSTDDDVEFAAYLAELQQDVEADRGELEQVFETLGIPRSAVKKAAGRLLEKASRIKFDSTASEDLTRLMETEALALGIEGKLAGWRALKVVSVDLGVDLDVLIQRAREIGGDREHWLEVLTPSPSDRDRGALTPNEVQALFAEEWPAGD